MVVVISRFIRMRDMIVLFVVSPDKMLLPPVCLVGKREGATPELQLMLSLHRRKKQNSSSSSIFLCHTRNSLFIPTSPTFILFSVHPPFCYHLYQATTMFNAFKRLVGSNSDSRVMSEDEFGPGGKQQHHPHRPPSGVRAMDQNLQRKFARGVQYNSEL